MVSQAIARYISEFLGTFLLVFTVGCNVLTGGPIWAVTSIAAVLMVSIYALGGVSGGHFNPAVTLALGLSRKMDRGWLEVGIYCAIQVAAGIVAGLSYGLLLYDVFNLAPAKGFGWWEAMLAEVLYTCMLCFVVLNVACTTSQPAGGDNQFYGLAIGFVVIAGGYGAGHISGGCFNPAVALGIDVSSITVGFFWGPIYVIYELLGACIASLLFRVVRPDEFSMHEYRLGAPRDYNLPTKLAAEFIGTYYLVLTVGLNVLGKSPAPVWSIAASLMCMIFALGNVSGAHFNPAVTLAILVAGRDQIDTRDACAYMGVQVYAGIAAALTYAGMEKGETFPLGPGEGFGWAAVAVAEVVYTFVLCFVVLSVATVSQGKLTQFFGFAIGSCVTAGGYAIGAISGGSLNPAVSVGISASMIINGGWFWKCLVYALFELAGAGLAALVFKATRPSEYPKGAISLP